MDPHSQVSEHSQLPVDPDASDPLGFGLTSIPESLQRWWLIGQGNPYFNADIKKARSSFAIPGPGFTDVAAYVDWVSRKGKLHGHDGKLPFYLKIEGEILDDTESLTRFHLRDLTRPLMEYQLPSRCCSTDPLFEEAEILAQIYEIYPASFEPGFPSAIEAVAGYLLVNQWPHARSMKGISWTEETDKIIPGTGKRVMSRVFKKDLGLESRAGAGRQLPVWYKWWMLEQGGKSISEIADITEVEGQIIDERTIRLGIKKVERLMTPVEKLSDS